MKRVDNLYSNILDLENINIVFNRICRNVKNRKKREHLKQYRRMYISRVYTILKNRAFKFGTYNTFTIYEPKKRIVVSLNLQDKIINHLISSFILVPALEPCLIDGNVASRKGFGTRKGLEMAYNFHRICKIKYEKYYILKCDISSFFKSIDHNILKQKLKKRIKDVEALEIIFKTIDGDKTGLNIGTTSSQILAVFFLNDLDHFIKEVLKIKYYVRYQDDFLLFHSSREYLKYCLKEIKKFLAKEKLTLNKKTRIYSNTIL